jgi:pantoate--beta-alanine ligase
MIVCLNKSDLRNNLDDFSCSTDLGFVPTMGALHIGHLALINRALNENDNVVVSIFVNPTQFDNHHDLEAYPRTLENDIIKLEKLGENIIVYAPSVTDIYPEGVIAEHFSFDGLDKVMEGASRNGHFDGVATVVKRLFEIVKPQNAYFGEKDFQQLQIVRKLVVKNKLSVNIIGCPIERDQDGLALSSRNTRLNDELRAEVPAIFKTLSEVKQMFGNRSIEELGNYVNKTFLSSKALNLDYFKITDEKTLSAVKSISKDKKYRAFIAAYAGETRLIDNISLN